MSIHIRRQNLRQSKIETRWVTISLAAALMLSSPAYASPTETPERETLRISKSLRPISDDLWKQVAGEQIAGKYDITRGDTLYDISKRLFGDARYWPKIWALNNGSILNPHLIRPGNRIAFLPGTGTSLPTVSIESADPGHDTEGHPVKGTLTDAELSALPPLPKIPARSKEWQMLPEQSWEASRIEAEQASKVEISVMGSLDKVHTLAPSRELSIFAATQPVTVFGEIVSSPTQTTYLKVGDQILIRGLSEEIKPGETYGVIQSPIALEKNEKKRQGLGYHVDGEVQIVGIQNGYWIGVIKQGRGLMERGSKLVALPPRVKPMDPIPAPAIIQGQFYVDKASSTYITGQHSFGFINLGSEDGIQEGMVLESYQPNDLNTGKALSSPELFHVADMQVVQVSERFSTVQIFSGATEVYDGMPVQLLTDISHLQKYGAIPSPNADTPPAPEPSETPPPAPADDAQSLDDPAAATETVPVPAPAPSPTAEVSPPAPETVPAPEATPSPAPVAEVPPPVTAPVVEPAPVEAPVTAPVATPVPATTPAPAPEQVPPPLVEQPAPASVPAPESVPAPHPTHTPNELDALDGEDKLAPHEEKELQQLENYKAKVPPAPASTEASTPVAPEAAPPAPTDGEGVQVF
ncbi:MAG: hypothetical protein ACJ763_12240 [Bdellovibrionia bacterium]